MSKPAPRHQKHWTEDEDRTLCWNWGLLTDTNIAKRLGRTVAACRRRASILLGSCARRTTTIAQLSRASGYTRKMLNAAVYVLNMPVRRTKKSRSGHALLSEHECEKIIHWLDNRITATEIAKEVRMDHFLVCEIARALGLPKPRNRSNGLFHRCFRPEEEAALRAGITFYREAREQKVSKPEIFKRLNRLPTSSPSGG